MKHLQFICKTRKDKDTANVTSIQIDQLQTEIEVIRREEMYRREWSKTSRNLDDSGEYKQKDDCEAT